MKFKKCPLFASAVRSFRASAVIATIGTLGLISSAQAEDYTWGGGSLRWSDTSASAWGGGPPNTSDTATSMAIPVTHNFFLVPTTPCLPAAPSH